MDGMVVQQLAAEVAALRRRLERLETQEGGAVALGIITAKGDLLVGDAAGSVDNLAVGANNRLLTADSAQGLGVKWAQGDHATFTNIGTNSHATIDAHLAATAAHGATGAVVGTTNTQTLSNKTISQLVLTRSDLVIAGDAITISNSCHRIDTEGAAATDDLATINGGNTFHIVLLQSTSSSRDITVKHGTGNIYLHGSADFVLDNSRDVLVLIKTGGEWNEVCRANNS